MAEEDKLIYEGEKSKVYQLTSGIIRKDVFYQNGYASFLELEILRYFDHPYLVSAQDIEIHLDKVSIYFTPAQYDLLHVSVITPSIDTVIGYFYQTCLGLAALHHRSIAHLDIKPDNIFIYLEKGRTVAKLGDFGFARYLSNYQHGSPLGTPNYFSPELLIAAIKHQYVIVDTSHDIWALGLTFFLLLSQDNAYEDIELKTYGSYAKYYALTNKLWLESKKKRKEYLKKNIPQHDLVTLFEHVLTTQGKRWSIDQVITQLEKVTTPISGLVITSYQDKSLPDEVQTRINIYLKRLIIHPPSIDKWITHLYHRYQGEKDNNLFLIIIIYLAMIFAGNRLTPHKYHQLLGVVYTYEEYLAYQNKILKSYYCISGKEGEKNKQEGDG